MTTRVVKDDSQIHFSVRTSVQFFVELVDFRRKWAVQFLEVLDDTFSLEHLFWQGSQIEAKARRDSAKGKRGPRTNRPQAKAKGKSKMSKARPKPKSAAMQSAKDGLQPIEDNSEDDGESEENEENLALRDAEASEEESEVDLDSAEEAESDQESVGSASIASLLESASLEELAEQISEPKNDKPQESEVVEQSAAPEAGEPGAAAGRAPEPQPNLEKEGGGRKNNDGLERAAKRGEINQNC